jgi:superfamily II DNA/RNA helicase
MKSRLNGHNSAANPTIKRAIVFVNARRSTDAVSAFLRTNGLKSTTING